MREQWKYEILFNWLGGGTPVSAELIWAFLYASYRSTKHSKRPGITYIVKKKKKIIVKFQNLSQFYIHNFRKEFIKNNKNKEKDMNEIYQFLTFGYTDHII